MTPAQGEVCNWALLGPRDMSDLSPRSGPKADIDQIAVTNRDRFRANRTSSQYRRMTESDQGGH
jgi:hypothetical protein